MADIIIYTATLMVTVAFLLIVATPIIDWIRGWFD